MVKEAKEKTVHIEGIWRLESTSAGLHPCEEHRFRNSVKDVQTLPGADIDSDHNLLFAKFRTRLKKIINSRKTYLDGIWRSYTLKDKECRVP